MPGIYIHIPFCKQACHYCNFHFSTTIKKKDQMVFALCNELKLRRPEIDDHATIDTIYFGGGTPTVLTPQTLHFIIETIYETYVVADDVEITIEANPDDLSEEILQQLAKAKVNRLSIGIQSFFDEDLIVMNRAHNATQAKECLTMATRYFDNISIDLIYGIPGMSVERWTSNLKTALAFQVPHISSYALTVEPKTALADFMAKGIIAPVDDAQSQHHFELLTNTLTTAGFDHYELSNFGKPGYLSKNNTAYWKGKTYLGIGPSAHSFNGKERTWNISNNATYLEALQKDQLPNEREQLSTIDHYNEYVMTGLRTMWGISLSKIALSYGATYKKYLLEQSQKHIEEQLLVLDGDTLMVTKKGKFLSDGIASDLFLVNLA